MMRNIALPVGRYDWHPELVPRAVYDARLAAFRAVLHAHGLVGAIITGSTFDDGALVWVTNFTPKLGPAFALVPLAGEPRLLFSGGAGMSPSAKKLTWFDNVAALRALPIDLADLRRAGPGAWGLVEDAGLSWDNRRAIVAACGSAPVEITAAVTRLRRVHEPTVLPLIRRAGAVMGQVESASCMSAAGQGTRWALRLAAERAAHAAGAQDIRLRLSRSDFGPAEPADPDDSLLPACAAMDLALRVENYWICGRTWVGTHAPAARNVWERLVSWLSAGSTPASLAQAAAPSRVEIVSVGHSLAATALDESEPFSPGQCVAITLTADASSSAGLSAVVEIGTSAPHVIWLAAPLQRTDRSA